jgi:3'(2'), 5'-bisphosphate nucleotidase
MIINNRTIRDVVSLAEEAGRTIMKYHCNNFEIIIKPDNSPVTTADLKANEIIVRELVNITSEIEIISEESSGSNHVEGNKFWLIDPLDGTRDFIKGGNSFVVSIGLIHNNEPVFGVIYVPTTKITYFNENGRAYKKYEDGYIEEISSLYNANNGLDVITSASTKSLKVREFMSNFKVRAYYTVSSAIKFCMLSEGKANIYPCFSETMAWDTAGGHAILRAAGGEVTLFDQDKPLLYDKHNFINPHFIAKGSEHK